MRYVTMTVNGIYGDQFEARTDDEAERIAEQRGYTVLETMGGDTRDDPNRIIVEG